MISDKFWVIERRRLFRTIERQHICNRYLCRVTATPVGLVLPADVVGESFLSICPTISAAACADLVFPSRMT